MARKKQQSETEKLNQKLGDALGMPVVQQQEPPSGSTNYAKDDEGKK